MEYALVDSNVVQQVIVADGAFISAHGDEVKTARGFAGGSWVECVGTVGIGYTYDSGTGEFSAPV